MNGSFGRGFGRSFGRGFNSGFSGRVRGRGRGRRRGHGRRGRGRGRRGRSRREERQNRIKLPEFGKINCLDVNRNFNLEFTTKKDLMMENKFIERKKTMFEEGKIGKKIKVATNFFKVDMEIEKVVQYIIKFFDTKGNDVTDEISPREGNQFFREIKDKGLVKVTKPYLFDGQRVLLCFENILNETNIGTEGGLEYQLVNRWKIFINKAKDKLKPEIVEKKKVIFRSLIMKKVLLAMGYWQIGRNFYHNDMSKRFGKEKMEIVLGFIQSLQKTRIGYALNVDLCYKPLRTENLWDFIRQLSSATENKQEFQEYASKLLKGSFVFCKYRRNKIYYINEVCWDKNLGLKIHETATAGNKTGKNEELNHGLYFEKVVRGSNIKIDPRQPLIKNIPFSARRDGIDPENIEDKDCIFLPPQLLQLCGLSQAMKDDRVFMEQYLNFTKFTPNDRIHKIFKIMKDQATREKVKDYLMEYGITQSHKLLELDARVLPRQKIIISKQEAFDVKGNWPFGSTLFKKIDLKTWMIVHHKEDFDEKKVKFFHGLFSKAAKDLKIQFPEPRIVLYDENTSESIQEAMEKHKENCQFAVVILDEEHRDLYTPLKNHFSTLDTPLLTQFVLSKYLQPTEDARDLRGYFIICKNLVVQIQTKLGGSPFAMKGGIGIRVMNCGFDMVKTNRKVVCGLVCSTNFSGTRFFSTSFVKTPQTDIPEKIAGGFALALDKFKKNNKKSAYPKVVVFFRSGLTFKQISENVTEEIRAIRAVINKIAPSIKLVFIAVLKNTHARFFFNENGKYVNPPVGTVVDHSILSPESNEFYLSSALPTQKTALPTKYVVLTNEEKLPADELQLYAFRMTHLYYNYNGSIRIPNTCKYAQKLARMTGRHVVDINTEERKNTKLNSKLWYL